MVNLEALRAQSLRAYEIGRLRWAAKMPLLLLPAVAICLLESSGRETCACLAPLLLGTALWLRWRDRHGVESVTTGLWAGGALFLVGLGLYATGLDCSSEAVAPYCIAFSALMGGAAGAFVARRVARRDFGSRSWLPAAMVAALAAGCGCARLGLASLASVTAGVGVGLLTTKAFRRLKS